MSGGPYNTDTISHVQNKQQTGATQAKRKPNCVHHITIDQQESTNCGISLHKRALRRLKLNNTVWQWYGFRGIDFRRVRQPHTIHNNTDHNYTVYSNLKGGLMLNGKGSPVKFTYWFIRPAWIWLVFFTCHIIRRPRLLDFYMRNMTWDASFLADLTVETSISRTWLDLVEVHKTL